MQFNVEQQMPKWPQAVSKMRKISSLILGKAGNAASLKDSHEEQDDGSVGSGEAATFGTEELLSSRVHSSEDDCSGAAGGPACTSDGNAYDKPSEFESVLCGIQELCETQGKLEESFQNLRASYHQEHKEILDVLKEDQFRCDLLEDQLINLTQLYQSEILNLKDDLTSVKDKIERSHEITDFHEVLEACQTRLLKMELRQEQVGHIEVPENTTMRNVVGKLINVLLAFTLVLLVFVSKLAHFVVPLRPSGCLVSALLFASLFFLIWNYWDIVSEYHNYLFVFSTP
ncbi:transmembrane and coiled-coil domains protein 1-like [Leuresthes tenuis]|uniref:transmembrane and coiled-coil domains protein 1-like n=1 Tax=Leuresthes tenuis TaxID=355514 RepID=UPI003B5150AB